MSNKLESLWVSWINSKRWRKFAKHGPGAKFIRNRFYQRLSVSRRYVVTYYHSRRRPALFQDVQTFCLFIGHAKSGGTLLGALLDAHPDIILADEIDVLGYVRAGFDRNQIFNLLLKGSRREALKGRVTARRLTPYSLAVSDQWQGRYRTVQTIGVSRAGPTVGQLTREPDLLFHLYKRIGSVETKFIHVIRNPFDVISLMIVRGQRSFANAIEHYFSYCETLMTLHVELDQACLLALRYEDFLARPQVRLSEVCHFLGLQAEEDYLQSCAAILYPEPEQSRQMVAWEDKWVEAVQRRINEVPFLKGYHYEDIPLNNQAKQFDEANAE